MGKKNVQMVRVNKMEWRSLKHAVRVLKTGEAVLWGRIRDLMAENIPSIARDVYLAMIVEDELAGRKGAKSLREYEAAQIKRKNSSRKKKRR